MMKKTVTETRPIFDMQMRRANFLLTEEKKTPMV